MKRKNIPFALSRTSRETLAEQVTSGLRSAIVSGYYSKGEILPPTQELAESLGVSRIVTRTAFAQLQKEGLVNSRPRIGCMVLGTAKKVWKGRILLITRGRGWLYYDNVFTATLRKTLSEVGWQLVAVPVDGSTAELELQLAYSTDLAIVLFENEPAVNVLSKANIAYVQLDGMTEHLRKSCICQICHNFHNRDRIVALECLRRSVSNILEVGCLDFSLNASAMKKFGVNCSSWTIDPPAKSEAVPESFALAAYNAFNEKLKSGKDWLPELIFFTDDYLCRGAMSAFCRAGIRVPDDVMVISCSNRGNRPILPGAVSWVEIDPISDATVLGEYLPKYLNGEKPAVPTVGIAFVSDESAWKGGQLC